MSQTGLSIGKLSNRVSVQLVVLPAKLPRKILVKNLVHCLIPDRFREFCALIIFKALGNILSEDQRRVHFSRVEDNFC